MSTQDAGALASIIRKLERLVPLDAADRHAMATLPVEMKEHPAGYMLVRESDGPGECCMLLGGYACRHKSTSEGGRQIVSFHLPGDMLDTQHLYLARADHNIQAITPVVIGWVPYSALKATIEAHPNIATALWRDVLIDASIFREWVLNIGRRDAKMRIAHMLCEFAARREAAGLGSPERFELPMTQEQIADATGLTSVHVNRMLQALSSDGIIARDRREVRIIDWRRMRQVADFDPAYLHMAA